MVKKAQGYLARDGSFFESRTEADVYETGKALYEAIVAKGIKPKPIVDLIEAGVRYEVKAFIQALEAHTEAGIARATAISRRRTNDHTAGQSDTVEANSPDDGSGEEAPAPVQQQQSRRRKHVSNVGSRKRTEEVSNGGKKHGA